MSDRIHTIQHEIKTIESIIDNLSGPMLDMAIEELRNLHFELDMLTRSMQKHDLEHLMAVTEAPRLVAKSA